MSNQEQIGAQTPQQSGTSHPDQEQQNLQEATTPGVGGGSSSGSVNGGGKNKRQKFDEEGESDSEDYTSPGERSVKGRRKINIEFIEDKSRRHITFSKRKAGIMKKAYELSTLTGTQVLLLIASETGHVYTFATPKLQPLIIKPEGKNLIQACLNNPDPSLVSPAMNSHSSVNAAHSTDTHSTANLNNSSSNNTNTGNHSSTTSSNSSSNPGNNNSSNTNSGKKGNNNNNSSNNSAGHGNPTISSASISSNSTTSSNTNPNNSNYSMGSAAGLYDDKKTIRPMGPGNAGGYIATLPYSMGVQPMGMSNTSFFPNYSYPQQITSHQQQQQQQSHQPPQPQQHHIQPQTLHQPPINPQTQYMINYKP